jgi:UDP-N-acetylmuramoyl-tripeptide--D-alanyl-D-alanine ligase
MMPLTLAEVAEAAGGSLLPGTDPEALVVRVVTDSREVAAGDLFVAIRGEHHDGHDHAAAAAAAGAAGVLASSRVGAPGVLVDDTVLALGAVARASLARLPGCRVVALTGSSGKTSTKDLLAAVLPLAGPTVATEGNLNNEIGLPLTALRADEGTRVLVVEMGMRGLGHIAYLCGIARPDVALVLNVGSAHLGELGSREAIADAKAELVDGLGPEGVAVLNADDPLVRAMASRAPGRVTTFGEIPTADVRATGVRLDRLARASFVLEHAGAAAPVALAVHGEHHVANALAAAAVALELGIPLAEVAAALGASAQRSRWRMEVTETPEGVTVVNDAYNANPESMRAALKALVAMAAGARSWAVLGEMRELGDGAMVEHDAIGRLAVRLDVDRLVVVGEGARALHMGAAQEGSWGQESLWVPDVDAALELLRRELAPGDVVLVKASRSAGLERVAEALVAGPAGQDGPP